MADFVLVDTDILIDAGHGNKDALTCLEQIEERSGLAISTITEMELVVGCRNKAELRSLEKFLERFELVPLTEQVTWTAIDLLKRYRLSHGLLIADALIAASAISQDVSFVTKNQSDFRFIAGLKVLDYPLDK